MIYWIIGIALFVIVFVLVISYACFKMAFYVSDYDKAHPKDPVPEGKAYEPHHEDMKRWVKETENTPHTEFSIQSFDGLTLYGNYYEYQKGAPIEIMFHGYRGNAKRDFSGGMQRCFELRRSALIVDQRGSGKSGGNVISFGVNEHKDCLSWVDFAVKTFGADVKIILTGISMGAATVLMAAGKELPSNVIGVLADCGYNSQKDIIKKVIGEMGYPKGLSYPFVKLGARLFGRFDLEETTPENALKTCKVPVIFFHGTADSYVPYYMSERNYSSCASKKKLVIVEGAEHGLSYLTEKERYYKELREFFSE